MPTITITKQPETNELAYGPNILTLTDSAVPSPELRFVCRVIDADTQATMSDARQLPNLSGYAHFDLQDVLKNQVSSNPNMETIPKLEIADYELFNYKLDIGYFSASVLTITDTTTGEFRAINGRKSFNTIDWDDSPYLPSITFSNFAGTDLIQTVDSRQKALTDRHYDTVTGAQITDGKPTSLGNTETVHKITLGKDDYYTLSFLNDWDTAGGSAYENFYSGIADFTFYMFDASGTQIGTNTLQNITGNGGGPNLVYGAAVDPTGSYSVITAQTSNYNSIVSAFPTTTHYYLVVRGWANEVYTGTTEISNWYRFDFDDGECNDFDHIQVSWLNSFGFRDYFTFEKRNDYQTTTSQETYRQLNADWSGTSYSVSETSRGERVFNNSLNEQYTAFTRYLSDEESVYLQNLYLSPDVRVRFNGEDTFVPVILTSNQYNQRTFRKDKLFQHEITFRLANPQQLQHG